MREDGANQASLEQGQQEAGLDSESSGSVSIYAAKSDSCEFLLSGMV